MGGDVAMTSWRHRGMMIGAQPSGPTTSHERLGKRRRDENATGMLYKQNIRQPWEDGLIFVGFGLRWPLHSQLT